MTRSMALGNRGVALWRVDQARDSLPRARSGSAGEGHGDGNQVPGTRAPATGQRWNIYASSIKIQEPLRL